MTSARPPGRPPRAAHLDTLLENVKEVKRLLEIHTQISGSSVGARHNVEVLNKSGIVLLVACWEAFVEDLAGSAFQLLLRRAKTPNIFPEKVLMLVAKNLKESRDERRVWDLAGAGWKSVLRNHQEQVLKRHVGSFNTPKSKQIDDLFRALIGLSKVSRKWSWHKCRPADARARLDKLVTLRGVIAHRVSAPRSVLKREVVNAITLVGRLAVATHNAVNASLGVRLGHRPWRDY